MGGPIRHARKVAKREDRELRRHTKATLKATKYHETQVEAVDSLINRQKTEDTNTGEEAPWNPFRLLPEQISAGTVYTRTLRSTSKKQTEETLKIADSNIDDRNINESNWPGNTFPASFFNHFRYKVFSETRSTGYITAP